MFCRSRYAKKNTYESLHSDSAPCLYGNPLSRYISAELSLFLAILSLIINAIQLK